MSVFDRSRVVWKPGDPSPIGSHEDRLANDKHDGPHRVYLQYLLDVLLFCRHHNEPLPNDVQGMLVLMLEVALSGSDGGIFKKNSGYTTRPFRKREHATKPSTNPMTAMFHGLAVDYIETCKKTGLDEHPVKTIMQTCRVSRSTVYRWINKYPADPLNKTKKELDEILESLRSFSFKIKSK